MGAPATHLYPYEPAPGWCSEFVGLPYERGARGPDAWDCWGLLVLVLEKRFLITVDRRDDISWSRKDAASRGRAAAFAKEQAAEWLAVPAGWEQPGDAVSLRIHGEPLHVGVVAAPGWMLHSAEDADSALERYDGMAWRNRVVGFHRHRGMTS